MREILRKFLKSMKSIEKEDFDVKQYHGANGFYHSLAQMGGIRLIVSQASELEIKINLRLEEGADIFQ